MLDGGIAAHRNGWTGSWALMIESLSVQMPCRTWSQHQSAQQVAIPPQLHLGSRHVMIPFRTA